MKPKPKPQPLWVLMITTRHGHDITLHQTQEGAQAELLAYVNDNWDREMQDTPKPSRRAERVSTYFNTIQEAGGDEFYDLDVYEVHQ